MVKKRINEEIEQNTNDYFNINDYEITNLTSLIKLLKRVMLVP